MALKKKIILPNGIPTEYHRIQEIVKVGDMIGATVLSYVSKYYRDESINNHVFMRSYNFQNLSNDISFSSVYELLKTQEEFTDAEDE